MSGPEESVYLDNAATTRLDERVWAAMEPYFRERFGNPGSLHRLGAEAEAGLELLDGVAADVDQKTFLAGEASPVFFGSALTNFGIEPFLKTFADMCPMPGPRPAHGGEVRPDGEAIADSAAEAPPPGQPDRSLAEDRFALERVAAGRGRAPPPRYIYP